MTEEKPDFANIPWLYGKPRSAEDVSRCSCLLPRALVSVNVSPQSFDVPQDSFLIGTPKKQMVVQVPMLTGPPMMVLVCRSPELLDYVKADQNQQLREQIKEAMPRAEFCALCPFWKAREGLETASGAATLANLPWYGKVICLSVMGLVVFAAVVSYPIIFIRSAIQRLRRK